MNTGTTLYRSMDEKTLLDVAMETIRDYEMLEAIDIAIGEKRDPIERNNLVIAQHILQECLARWVEINAESEGD